MPVSSQDVNTSGSMRDPPKEIEQVPAPSEEEYDIANMSPDKVDKLLSDYTWFPLENTTTAGDLLDWEAFFAG